MRLLLKTKMAEEFSEKFFAKTGVYRLHMRLLRENLMRKQLIKRRFERGLFAVLHEQSSPHDLSVSPNGFKGNQIQS